MIIGAAKIGVKKDSQVYPVTKCTGKCTGKCIRGHLNYLGKLLYCYIVTLLWFNNLTPDTLYPFGFYKTGVILRYGDIRFASTFKNLIINNPLEFLDIFIINSIRTNFIKYIIRTSFIFPSAKT